jgi:hypothetical protein
MDASGWDNNSFTYTGASNTYAPPNVSYVDVNQQEDEVEQPIPNQSSGSIESLLHMALAQIAQLQDCLDKRDSKAPAPPAPTPITPTTVSIKPQKPDTFDGQRGGLSTDAWLFQLEQYGELTNLDEAILVQFAAILL